MQANLDERSFDVNTGLESIFEEMIMSDCSLAVITDDKKKLLGILRIEDLVIEKIAI